MNKAGAPLHDDTLDLPTAWQWVWRARRLVVGMTLLALAVSALLVWTLVPVTYETRVELLPPRPADLSAYALVHQLSSVVVSDGHADQDSLRAADVIPALSVDQVYRVFLRHLTSARLRDRFVAAYFRPQVATSDTLTSRARLHDRLDESVRFVLPDGRSDRHGRSTLIWRGTDPEQIAIWANTYVAWAMRAAQQELMADLRSEIQMRRHSAQAVVEVLRRSGAVERRFEIARVSDALRLAQAVHLDGPAQGVWVMQSDLHELAYLQGSRALQAQLDVLLAREQDEPYIRELPSVRYRQALLETLAARSLTMRVATWDARVQAPTVPTGPDRPIMVLWGGVLGLVLGLGWALGRGAWLSRAPRHPVQSDGRDA